MPIEFIIILFIPFTMLCFLIGAVLHDLWHQNAPIPVSLLWLGCLLFIIVDYNFNYKEENNESIFIAKTIENIDFIIDDGEFVNLNALLSKDIKEGQKIKKNVQTYKSLLSNTTRVIYKVDEDEKFIAFQENKIHTICDQLN